jgi:hypothetical protein
MQHTWPYPVGPRSLILRSRHSERRSGKLLSVKPKRRVLRRIPSHRQRAFNRFGREFISKSRLVFWFVHEEGFCP